MTSGILLEKWVKECYETTKEAENNNAELAIKRAAIVQWFAEFDLPRDVKHHPTYLRILHWLLPFLVEISPSCFEAFIPLTDEMQILDYPAVASWDSILSPPESRCTNLDDIVNLTSYFNLMTWVEKTGDVYSNVTVAFEPYIDLVFPVCKSGTTLIRATILIIAISSLYWLLIFTCRHPDVD